MYETLRDTERVQFQEWVRVRWGAMTVEERARAYEDALSDVWDVHRDDVMESVLVRGVFPWGASASDLADRIRVQVVFVLLEEWIKEQVRVGKVEESRAWWEAHGAFQYEIDDGELNSLVPYEPYEELEGIPLSRSEESAG